MGVTFSGYIVPRSEPRASTARDKQGRIALYLGPLQSIEGILSVAQGVS